MLFFRTWVFLSTLIGTGANRLSRMSHHFNSQLGCAANARSELLVSVVVGTSNDAPSDQLMRLTQQYRNIAHFSGKYGLERKIEYIVVEWNYDRGRPGLYSFLKPHFLEHGPLVRVIRVDNETHNLAVKQMGAPFHVHFMEFQAKNVGIRRACGRFLLPTNSDNLFTEGFFAWLHNTKLDEGAYYRAPRCDWNGDAQAQINKSAEEVITAAVAGLADCGCHCRGPAPFPGWREYLNVPLDDSWSVSTRSEDGVECIQCPGDFLLLSKQNFERFRGYPNVALPHQLDDVPVWQSVASRLKFIHAPPPVAVMHMNHERGYRSLDERWQHAAFMVDAYKLQQEGAQMMQDHVLRVYNDHSWGLGQLLLEEDAY